MALGSFPIGGAPIGGSSEEESQSVGPGQDVGGGGGIDPPGTPHWRYVPPRRKKRPVAKVEEPAEQKPVAPPPKPAPQVPRLSPAEMALQEQLALQTMQSIAAQEQAMLRMAQPQPLPDPAALRAQAMQEEEDAITALALAL